MTTQKRPRVRGVKIDCDCDLSPPKLKVNLFVKADNCCYLKFSNLKFGQVTHTVEKTGPFSV